MSQELHFLGSCGHWLPVRGASDLSRAQEETSGTAVLSSLIPWFPLLLANYISLMTLEVIELT